MNNYNLIKCGLIYRYNFNVRDTDSIWFLTLNQIDGILDYLDDMGIDLNEFDIELFIDDTLINGNGFNEFGEPIEEMEIDNE